MRLELRFIPTFFSPRSLTPEHPKKPFQRVVEFIDDAFLQWNDGVVRNRNTLRTHCGATLRNVAVADALGFGKLADSIFGIERMHLQGRNVYEEPWADEFVVQLMFAQDVADVL